MGFKKFKEVLEALEGEDIVPKNNNLDYVRESSLSRLWSHNKAHDCGALTAFRKYNNCGFDDKGEPCGDTPIENTKKDNQKRNLALASDLKKVGYGITKVIGSYPEGGSNVKEVSYFVVDLQDNGKLKNDLKKLGKKYDQDSVLYVPKGAIDNSSKEKAHLIGTNTCCNNFLGYGETLVFNKGKIGYDSPIYTSYVGGRPFIFESCRTSDEVFGSSTNALVGYSYSKDINENDDIRELAILLDGKKNISISDRDEKSLEFDLKDKYIEDSTERILGFLKKYNFKKTPSQTDGEVYTNGETQLIFKEFKNKKTLSVVKV